MILVKHQLMFRWILSTVHHTLGLAMKSLKNKNTDRQSLVNPRSLVSFSRRGQPARTTNWPRAKRAAKRNDDLWGLAAAPIAQW